MLINIERMFILKSIELFSEIPEKNLFIIAEDLKEIEFLNGDKIIREGDNGTSMYIIVKGSVSVSVKDNHIATLKSGEIFGELSALDPEPRSATITALETTTVFEISNRVIYELIGEYSDVAKGIIKVLCRRVRNSVSK
jgi:CRP/FNR family cyclic AMP-dependent transcriptional regulator